MYSEHFFGGTGRISKSIDVVTLLIAFGASRLAYTFCGVEFRMHALLTFWMQVLDVRQLRDNLAEAIWYLHAQPPLYNIVIGAVLRAPEQAQPAIFTVLYSAVALTGILCFHRAALEISGNRLLSWCVALLLIISPATILYERAPYYEGLVSWQLVVGFYLLWRFLARDQFIAGAAAWLVFASVVLMRTAFHPVWLAATVAILLAAQPPRWRRILVTSAPGLLLVGAVMLKNEIVFGQTSLSSWMPNNLLQQAGDPVPLELREVLVQKGVLSRYGALHSFSPPDVLRRVHGNLPITGIAVLDDEFKLSGSPNYNNIIYLITEKQIMSDALYLMVHYPFYYLDQKARAVVIYFRPSSDYRFVADNLRLIARWDRIYSLVVDGQPAALFGSTQDKTRPKHSLFEVGYFTLAEVLAVLVGALALARDVIRRRRIEPARAGWLLTVCTTVLFISVIDNIFDSGETNRARFMVEPLIYLFVIGLAIGFPEFSRTSRWNYKTADELHAKARNSCEEHAPPG